MDTSETYIKMCERAKEIQALAPEVNMDNGWIWDWRQGSVFWLPQEKEFALYHWDNDEGHFIIGGYNSELEGKVWLPRQDQLQEMVRKNLWNLCSHIGELCQFGGYPYGLIGSKEINSMEQLWLAFVMEELYHKKWDGIEWK